MKLNEDLKPQRAISAYQSAAVECKNRISTWCSNETLAANSQSEHKVDNNHCQQQQGETIGTCTKQLQVVSRYNTSRLSLSGCNDKADPPSSRSTPSIGSKTMFSFQFRGLPSVVYTPEETRVFWYARQCRYEPGYDLV